MHCAGVLLVCSLNDLWPRGVEGVGAGEHSVGKGDSCTVIDPMGWSGLDMGVGLARVAIDKEAWMSKASSLLNRKT